MKRNILFVTYYWPPSGKASLHWPLKMIQYFPALGWQPYVLTVDEDKLSNSDESLLAQIDPSVVVAKTKTWEPFSLYKIFIGKNENETITPSEMISKENKSIAHRLSVWIRMNLFIPDARIGWYPFAVKEGKKFKKEIDFDAVVSIGPPHSAHLIGLRLAKYFKSKHVPVFIDPWADIVYYKDFKRNFITRFIDSALERIVLKSSMFNVFVTQSMHENYAKKHSWLANKSHVLYWGYSEEAFTNVKPPRQIEETKILLHAGNIFDYQNPVKLWELLKMKIDAGEKIILRFVGTVSPGIKKEIENHGLADHVDYIGFLPYHEVLEQMYAADYLLVCVTEKRHVPGKLFEYLRTGKAILAFGDDNEEARHILQKAKAGMIFRYDESPEKFFYFIRNETINLEYIESFDRKKIAFKFSELLYEKLYPHLNQYLQG